jgi:hypothetical protein
VVATFVVKGIFIYVSIVGRHRVPVFEKHRLPSIGSRWDIRWVSGRGQTWYFLHLAWRLWESVSRLAVRGNTVTGGVDRRHRVPVYDKHRLPSTGSRWDIWWVNGGGIA